jgi:hypothetical protein
MWMKHPFKNGGWKSAHLVGSFMNNLSALLPSSEEMKQAEGNAGSVSS